MAKPTTVHVCSACGHQEARWHGQCPGCGEWNTLVEEAAAPAAKGRRGGGATARPAARPVRLRDVETPQLQRRESGIREFDRVLGGSPGIGKSTLTAMALGNLVASGRRALYLSLIHI